MANCPPAFPGKMRGCTWQTGGRAPQIGPKPSTPEGDTQPQKIFNYRIPDALFRPGETPTLSAVISVRLAERNFDGTQQVVVPNQDYSDAWIQVRAGTGDDSDEQIFDIDLINGTIVPLAARSGTFALLYPEVEGELVQPILDISIGVAMGTCATGERPPRRTIKVGDLTMNVEKGFFRIPRFAHGAVLQTTDATAQAILRQYTAPLNGSILKSQAIVQKQEYQSVPIAHGATGFSLEATAAATGAAVIFYLATG